MTQKDFQLHADEIKELMSKSAFRKNNLLYSAPQRKSLEDRFSVENVVNSDSIIAIIVEDIDDAVKILSRVYKEISEKEIESNLRLSSQNLIDGKPVYLNYIKVYHEEL